MSELTIRRDNMTFTPPNLQGVVKTEKQSASAPAQKAAAASTVNISDTLQDLMTRIGQTEGQLRESRNALQLGQAVLDEVQDSLDKIEELTKESIDGEEPDREALQTELEKLVSKIERMVNSVSAGDKPLFIDGKADLIEGLLSGEIDMDEMLDAVRQLLEKLTAGMPPETALETLDLGSPLLSLLMGIGGMNLDLMMSLLTALESSQTALEPEAGVPDGRAETAEASGPATNAAAGTAPEPLRAGALQITGTDLSGVTFNEATGEVTIAGPADVVIQGNGQEQAAAIRLTGSGQVTLQDVKADRLTVEGSQARVVSEGETQLGGLQMEKGASLEVGGSGQLRLGTLSGDGSNLLRLTGEVTLIEEAGERPSKEWTVPVTLESAATLLARAAAVRTPEGKPLEAFDLMWKALMPSLSTLTKLEVDGKAATRQSLMNGDAARLWLNKGDPSHGCDIHAVLLQGKDKSGQLQSRYAYVRWEQRRQQFQEVDMYPNPFTVTGGEEGQDWIYEEESHTLRILTAQVTGISGGAGMDANEEPFSGRLVLADHIALIRLMLNGVMCRVPEGKAFDLGRDNEVFLTLASGSRNVFESGGGLWGISMGEDSHVNIGYAEGPAGILAATIGTEDALEPESEPEPEPEEGIPLRMGGGTVTLPQFPLSTRAMRLDMMQVSTQEYAQASLAIVNADRQWVSQIQSVYQALYSQLTLGSSGYSGGRQAGPAAAIVRDTAAAGTLMEDVKKTILLQPEVAWYLHSRRGRSELQRLLK